MSLSPPGLTFEDLYAQHWRYVLQVLPDYGVPASDPDQDDVAQAVWLTVHGRLGSYDAGLHQTPRAWITGITRRCAANHRRTERRRPEVVTEDAGAWVPARGLDPEQWALLQTVNQAIRKEERREALVLRVRHGLSVKEIAAAQEVSEDAVEWRLHMAKEDLKADDGEKKSRAFLGYGSLEALAEALRPEPIPDERGAELWKRITEQIRQQQGETTDGAPPSSSFPPAALVPAIAPMLPPAALLAFTKAKLAGLLVGAFVGGAAAGVGGVFAWQAYDAARQGREAAAMETCAPETLLLPVAETAPLLPAAMISAPASSPSPASSPRPTSSPAMEAEAGRLLGQIRRAAGARKFALVLALAEQHRGQFPDQGANEREAFRLDALIQLGRSTDAEGHARTTTAAHPDGRRTLERAAERALP